MPEPSTPAPTPERIFQAAWGYTIPLILEAAIRNKVFDTLDAGPQTVPEVSKATGASVRGLQAIMNALVGLEFLTRTDDAKFALTPESSLFLVTTKPSFTGGILKHTSTQLIPKWLTLSEIVRTGKPASSVNQEGDGSKFFHEFVEDIFPMSYPAASNAAQHFELASASGPVKVLDLASGSGVWGIAFAQASQQVQVRAVDWESVLEVTRRVSTRFGLADRFEYVGDDLLDADFGTGHHYATLGHIFHSEGADRSKKLIAKVFDALAPGGKITIAEMVPNHDRKGPTFPLLFAVNMLVATDNGDTFSFEEMTEWLAAAGFVDAYTLPGPGPSPLLIASKPL